MRKNIFKTISICIFIVVIISSCSDKKVYKGKALVLLLGETQNGFFEKEKTFIAYRDVNDSVHVKKVELPDYAEPVAPGDSVDITVFSSKIEFGKLYSYQTYSLENRFFYEIKNLNFSRKKYSFSKEYTKKALFDNGVLTIGTMDLTGKMTSLEFYTYKNNNQKSIIEVSPIGFPNSSASTLKGKLGKDTLWVKEDKDAFYLMIGR